jgi:putative DNA methylase
VERRRLEAQLLPKSPYREWVDQAQRPEEVITIVHDRIWESVNAYLGTSAQSFPELVEQLGIMRYGHRCPTAEGNRSPHNCLKCLIPEPDGKWLKGP